ncbi:MAG: homogentisate 1,2-dioxygenase [Elusimicrobia bacterium]|nr:homogentisate 1,2-dioxygenase [Elusimicrobiota bacterium]
MATILRRGKVPSTPHTEFYAQDGILALEEIHGTLGFNGAFSRKMHLRHYPTELIAPPREGNFHLCPRPSPEKTLQPYHIPTARIPSGADLPRSRKVLLWGPHTVISIAKPDRSMPENTFFRNGEKHELFYVQEGEGTLDSEYGRLRIGHGLYLIVPKGTTYRMELKSKSAFLLVVESSWPIQFAPHYLNEAGQARMMAPVVETEIEAPEFLPPRDAAGKFHIDVQHASGQITRLTLGHHPFDLAGWEGALYPFGFDIRNHHGIAREIHTAPPMHQTFQSGRAPYSGFSLCSFVSQMEGWHPKEVPAPYAHYNVDSDEVMFFSNSHYGARKGVISEGSLTFHPSALPHSPQGHAALRSLKDRGKISRRLAVMVDTFFESLHPTAAAHRYRDPGYPLSWHRAAGRGLEPQELLHGT